MKIVNIEPILVYICDMAPEPLPLRVDTTIIFREFSEGGFLQISVSMFSNVIKICQFFREEDGHCGEGSSISETARIPVLTAKKDSE